ncbi:MAG: hypothetical protein ACRELB_06120, partial [Polyangiaceae bacterium]
ALLKVVPAAPRGGLATPSRSVAGIDRESLLACIDGSVDLATAEKRLNDDGLTLGVEVPSPSPALADWLATGAPGSRDRWLDPADQLLAGLDASLPGDRQLVIRPAPRRAVGPDLTALLVGAHDRFGRVDRAWMRVHKRDVTRPATAFDHDRDPPVSSGEAALLDAIARELG